MVVLVKFPVIGVPFPEAAIPVRFVVLSLVQLNTVPITVLELVNIIVVIGSSEQID